MAVRSLLRTNQAYDPRATANIAAGDKMGWRSTRWFGTSGSGTYTYLKDRNDGPVPGLKSYIHKEWSVSGGAADTGFEICSGFNVGSTTNGWPVTPGDIWTFSAYVRTNRTGITGPIMWDITWHDIAGNFLSRDIVNFQTLPVDGTWLRPFATFTVPANAALAGIVLDIDATNPAWQPGDWIEGTGLLVESGSILYDWFCGASFETQNRFQKWNGQVDYSTSSQYLLDGSGSANITPGKSLLDLKSRMLDIILGPTPTRVAAGEVSLQNMKKAAFEKVLSDNGISV